MVIGQRLLMIRLYSKILKQAERPFFLKGDKYVDARDKTWVAMKDAVQPNGMVGWVQQIGKDPQLTIKDSSQLYGVGGFLLMASH